MVQTLAQNLPTIILTLFALAFVVFLLSLQQLRRGRTGPYWRIRKEAGQRGGQLFLLSVALFAIAGAMAFFSGFAAVAIGGLDQFLHPTNEAEGAAVLPTFVYATDEMLPPSDTPEPTPTATATLFPTNTRAPSTTPTATFTPSDTPTPSITPTPTATYETALRLAPLPNARAPRPSALVRVIAADNTVSGNGTPLESRTEFPAGIERVYFFISYRFMDNGVEWSRILYREGAPLQGSTLMWSLGEEGSSYFFFGTEDGYAPGNYRVELRLGSQVASEFEFVVTE